MDFLTIYVDVIEIQTKRIKYLKVGDLKISTREGSLIAGGATKFFLRYLNSFEFINFVQRVCDLERDLIADHTLLGGGLHSLADHLVL